MKEITRYHNDLNLLITRKWTAEEMDIFFALVTKAQGKGTREIALNKNELEGMIRYSQKSNKRLEKTLEELANHLLDLRYIERNDCGFALMVLFQSFKAVWNKQRTDCEITVRVSDSFEYVLNKLNANFTSFEFAEFATLRRTYSKTLYRLLKQYRTTGERYFTVQDFKNLMGIPAGYKSNNIKQKVLDPALTELSGAFPDLAYTTIKAKAKGNPITGYRFTWKPEHPAHWVDPDEYRRKKRAEAAKKGRNKPNLPDWYNDIPEEKATKEEIEAVLKLQREVLGE